MANDTTSRGQERAQAGQSLTELPIALVLLIVLAFGIMDAGRLIYAYNAVSLSAREGVRWAAVRGGASGHAASQADIQDFVQSKTVGVPVTVGATWLPESARQHRRGDGDDRLRPDRTLAVRSEYHQPRQQLEDGHLPLRLATRGPAVASAVACIGAFP